MRRRVVTSLYGGWVDPSACFAALSRDSHDGDSAPLFWLDSGVDAASGMSCMGRGSRVVTQAQGVFSEWPSSTPGSGSTPESVFDFLRSEQTYGVDLFNRFNMAYKLGEEVHVVNKEDFETLITIKKITKDTIVFNNLVETLADYQEKWEVPLSDSWHQMIFAEQLNA